MDLRTRSSLNDELQPSNLHYGIPIYDLLSSVEKKRTHSEAVDGQRPEESTAETAVQRELPSADRSQNTIDSQRKKRKKANAVETTLLSEKYRSNQFFDLMGNDDANRQILRWITYWKSCVHGTAPTLNDETDRLGRPLRKLLLVNGPPGSGKTTAVHVIARQAGFDVLEINASDERGAAVVKDRISSAVESHQVSSKRPIAIVADEVEGAAEHGFVRALTNMLVEDAKALGDTGRSRGSASGKGKKRKHTLLMRPIIAICNDVWSPNLHNLRQYAEIVHFQRHAPNRLIKRLEQICVSEKLRFGARQLSEVAEQCDYDLRACLNALQFGAKHDIESYGRESVELTDWTALVKQQFLHPKPATFKQLECCSDIDKLIAACFTAYPDSSYIDDLLKKPASIGDYLAMADNKLATDEMKALAADSFGRLFRSPRLAAQKVVSARGGGRAFGKPPSFYEERKRTQSIVDSIRKNAALDVKTTLSDKRALLEFLPFIIKLSEPTTRKVLEVDDKAKLALVAGALKDFGVMLRTSRLENGTFAHQLDPPIELTCIFGDTNRASASAGTYVTRAQIKDAMHEISKHHEPSHSSQRSLPPRAPDSKAVEKPKPVKAAVDFSSFFVNRQPETATQAQRKADAQAKKVWVQFSEGFSNAVRKPISWTELLYM